jgi:tripartite-type tricarboxylate transporter receptor subunit TctC
MHRKESHMKKLFSLAGVALSVSMCLAPAVAQAQAPVTVVVPFAPGGNIDITARTVAPIMSKELGQTVVIENRPGAGGMLGANVVAKANADGQTLLLASTGSLAAAPVLYPTLQFDPVASFAMARAITRAPLVLVVNPALQVKSVKDLIALAKSKPGGLRMASTGQGTSNHLTGVLFQNMSGVQLTHVPYKGSSQALTDLIGGQVDLMFDNIPTSLPHVKSGKLVALAMTSAQRSAVLPDVPTVAESGLPGFEASTITGIAVPAGTPAATTQKIDAAVAKALASSEVRAIFAGLGVEVVQLSGPEFTALMKSETAKWSKVARDAGVRLE